ncbi:thermopsin-like protease [Thermoproteus tenax]|uniref:Thermopsin-like protease n=1 Tax=Thermoproteus tenax (strain ATCC 35583 / DSM 2078 / JCM 9277 / NBRC 100435 / Kra 1) TaxID=768679 RepID=G4RNX5_THETK|nr:thermopsin-like protease [Thermoproteus tenax]CCC81269.1 Thermopsin-like protease [Thermoproteus tenax Kra 1]
MRTLLLAMLLTAALALATTFQMYELGGPRHLVWVTINGQTENILAVLQEFWPNTVLFPVGGIYWLNTTNPTEARYTIFPAYAVSPWLPNGSLINVTFTRAEALFNVSGDLLKRVRWGMYTFIYNIATQEGTSPAEILQEQNPFVSYGLQVVLKEEPQKPILDCLSYVGNNSLPSFWSSPGTVWSRYHIPFKLYNVTCPGNTSYIDIIDVEYRWWYDGGSMLCLDWLWFRQREWYLSGGRYDIFGIYLPRWEALINQTEQLFSELFSESIKTTNQTLSQELSNEAIQLIYKLRAMESASDCVNFSGLPRNITAVVGGGHLRIYVDGQLIWTLNVSGVFISQPYSAVDWFGPSLMSGAYFYVDEPAMATAPLGSALLFIGNDSVVAPPKYATNLIYSIVYLVASTSFSWEGGLSVGPGETNETYVYVRPDVNATIYGRPARLPYMAIISLGWLRERYCPYGDLVLSGAYRRIGGSIEVLGPVSISCTEYPVRFILPNGSSVPVVARANSTVRLPPLAVDLGNGTRLVTAEVEVNATGPADVVVPVAQRLYRVEVETPVGVNATWAPAGAAIKLSTVTLPNGTRYVPIAPVAVNVTGPIAVAPRYERQYLVRLIAPANSTEEWADEGALFNVTLADPWIVGNGTMFSGLLVNGTGERSWRVVKPITLVAGYAEVYYWVSVETPVNRTAGWMPKGAVLAFPDVLDLGNGTRLVGPSVQRVVVEGPANVSVAYAERQYYVQIEGVEEWSGWADAGSALRLNSTVVDGVVYRPLEDVVVSRPGVYRPEFLASYAHEFRDLLGVPDPAASVELCGVRAGADLAGRAYVEAETDRLCAPALSAWPVSPYTLAAVAAAAAAAYAAIRRRR